MNQLKVSIGVAHRDSSKNPRLGFLLALLLCASSSAVMAQPANDNFANRAAIIGTNAGISGSIAGATFQTGEPFILAVSSGQTAWWTWTAPSNGVVQLSAAASGFAPLLAVYTGANLATLSLVASNNYVSCYQYCGCHMLVRDRTTFHVRGGQVYQIAVDAAIHTDALYQDSSWVTNVSAGGPVNLQLQFALAPKNDNFEQRSALYGARLRIPTSNTGASKQLNEPDHLGNTGGSSLWYSWRAPASGRVTLSANQLPVYSSPTWTLFLADMSSGDSSSVISWGLEIETVGGCGVETDQNPLPTFAPIFAAYTGSSLNTLTPANCLPMGLEAYPDGISFDAVKGQTYQIAVDGNQGTTSDFTLCLALTKPAVNDSFARRIRLHGIHATATSYNAGATHQLGEPIADGSSVGKTVWWSWRAPVSGPASIDLDGSDYWFPLAVYTGSTLSKLIPVPTASSGATRHASFEAVEGETYQIAVSDDAGRTGAIKLELQSPIVEITVARILSRSPRAALLIFPASRGQVILLIRSMDGQHWQNLSTAVAHLNNVQFLVHPAPTDQGPYYRAIVVDRVFYPSPR
jgi:hypothetical protein